MLHRSLYTAFDLYPSAKGAATHIYHFSSTMFAHYGGGQLYVLGNDKLPMYQHEDQNIEVFRFAERIPNYLARAQAFSAALRKHIQANPALEMVHFRDIWGGLAALQEDRSYACLYEVNGLPSIELPYRYPELAETTLEKLRHLEQFCLEKADRLVVPSEIIRQHLLSRGLQAEKIDLISNGADAQMAKPETAPAVPENYILYFGALQAWQGITDLFKAFAGLADKPDLQLVICASIRPKQAKAYRKLAEKMGIAERLHWEFQLPKAELAHWIRHAQLTVAPLTECSRNLDQGCCPLKILESMVEGTTVVASDLPVVRELLTDNVNGKLVRAGRPALLSRAIRSLLDFPAENQRLAQSGKATAEKEFAWKDKKTALIACYRQTEFQKSLT